MLYAFQIETGTLPGMVANIIILSVIVAFIGSIVVLLRYKRAASALMSDKTAPSDRSSVAQAPPAATGVSEAEYLHPSPILHKDPQLLRTVRRRMRRLIGVYAAAGLCCTLLLALA